MIPSILVQGKNTWSEVLYFNSDALYFNSDALYFVEDQYEAVGPSTGPETKIQSGGIQNTKRRNSKYKTEDHKYFSEDLKY